MSDKYAALKQAAEGAFSSWSRYMTASTKDVLALLAERDAGRARIAELGEALERALRANAAQDDHINQQQDRIDELEKGHQEAARQINAWHRLAKQNISEREKDLSELDSARQRVAELEAREIKPAQGEVLVTITGYTGCGKSAIAGEIEIAMKAIGVPVEWTNGDAEKRTTGADWLTAIEMYKPSVRIVEVNVPRSAGISLKIEGE